MKYPHIWLQLTKNAFASTASNRIDSTAYFLAKLVRFGFFILMITSLFSHSNTIVGYTKMEVLLFYLTFNFIDVFTQALFRGVYLFKWDINRGNFDYVLTKPINLLFYALSRLNDLLDMMFLLPIAACLVYVMMHLNVVLNVWSLLWYVLYMGFGVVLVMSMYMISMALTIWTMESENFIWFYRYTINLGAFPPEVYAPWIQIALTFIIPVIVITAFPAKVLLGILSVPWMIMGAAITALFFIGAYILWHYSLNYYSSASS